MSDVTLSPEQKRRSFIADWDSKVFRMEDQLQKALKLLAMQIQILENDMTAGMSYKMEGLDDKKVRLLKDVTASFNSLTDAKIRLDKTAKQRAEQMTPEEEREAVTMYVMALPRLERGAFLKKCVDRHNAEQENSIVRTDRKMTTVVSE